MSLAKMVGKKKSKSKLRATGGSEYIKEEMKVAEAAEKRKPEVHIGRPFEESTEIKGSKMKSKIRGMRSFDKKPSVGSHGDGKKKKREGSKFPSRPHQSMTCPTHCADLLKSKRRRTRQSDQGPPSPPDPGCVKKCRRKIKMQGDGPATKGKAGKKSKKTDEEEISVCDPNCGDNMSAMSLQLERMAGMFTGKQPSADLCLPLCCPPNAPNETELIDAFVKEMMDEVELATVDLEECLCDEVSRWMRYFMCGCGLGRGGLAQLAEAVVEADGNIPGLLQALVNELTAQAEMAQKPPKGKKKITPEQQRMREHVATRALRAVKHLNKARDRLELAAALKVAEDIAAKEYEAIMKAQLDVMMDMLEKKIQKDFEERKNPYLVEMTSSEMITKAPHLEL